MSRPPKDRPFKDRGGRAVPSRRLSRLAGLGGMAANVAGGMMLSSAKQLASGKRPKLSDLVMTPKNARKVTRQLSNMRGAAMKIGQMISMDSGDFLPKEFADILARLRADAQHMPGPQLDGVLRAQWGEGWQAQFKEFDYHPIAAASIGQVHYAELPDGETLAIKVQYPGVRDSIDSDINNVASLLRMTGLVPSTLDIKPVIEEGRVQLHQEADYLREAEYLSRFGELLAGDNNFEVPDYYPDLSTDKILTMSYLEGTPIEDMADAPQETRDRIIYLLIDLLLSELFVFKTMQTDPNFANYQYNEETDKLVLLDFGASRDIEDTLSAAYQNLMQTVVSGRTEETYAAAMAMGLIAEGIPDKYQAIVLELLGMVREPLSRDAPFDFGDNNIALDMRETAMELAGKRELWHVPPSETIFIQRKFGGIYMLATRLKARVNIYEITRKYAGDRT